MENLFDAYDFMRTKLCGYLTAALGRPFQTADFYCPAKCAPVSLSLAKLRDNDTDELVKKLNNLLDSKPLSVMGTDAVKYFEAFDGLLLIHFSAKFYDVLMKHTIDILPEPFCIEGDSRVHYALNRMLMLARKPHSSCPDDLHVQRALWMALGIPERLHHSRLLRLRILDVSNALLTMTHHCPPKKRPALLNRCGGVAECAARLLTIGLKTSIGGDVS